MGISILECPVRQSTYRMENNMKMFQNSSTESLNGNLYFTYSNICKMLAHYHSSSSYFSLSLGTYIQNSFRAKPKVQGTVDCRIRV